MLPVPYEGTVSYGAGAARGPAAILEASSQVELFDLELDREPWRVGIHMAAPVEPGNSDPARMAQRVQEACAMHHAAGKLVMTLGGEHGVAVGACRAAAREHGELSILQIDAHLDLRDSYDGTRYSHACTARRMLDCGRVVAVGPRVACPEEMRVLSERGLAPVWGHELADLDDQELAERVLSQLGQNVYVTLDVDGLDPSIIPATGTPVPGGLGWYQTLALLRAVGEKRKVVGCDFCELAPREGDHLSDFAAALLAYKMVGYFGDPGGSSS